MYLTIPFIGKHAMQIRHRLSKLLKGSFPQINFRIVFKTSTRLRDFFHFKDRIPLHLRSLVVYKYKCRSCSASYLGKTKRHLHRRVCEHRGVSSRTGNPLTVPPHSAIRDHATSTGHDIAPASFKIVSTAANDFELKIFESLLIAKDKPNLNV